MLAAFAVRRPRLSLSLSLSRSGLYVPPSGTTRERERERERESVLGFEGGEGSTLKKNEKKRKDLSLRCVIDLEVFEAALEGWLVRTGRLFRGRARLGAWRGLGAVAPRSALSASSQSKRVSVSSSALCEERSPVCLEAGSVEGFLELLHL